MAFTAGAVAADGRPVRFSAGVAPGQPGRERVAQGRRPLARRRAPQAARGARRLRDRAGLAAAGRGRPDAAQLPVGAEPAARFSDERHPDRVGRAARVAVSRRSFAFWRGSIRSKRSCAACLACARSAPRPTCRWAGATAGAASGIEGRTPTPDAPTRAHPRAVTPGYFQAIGITLLAGPALHGGGLRRRRRKSRSSTTRWRGATGPARRRSASASGSAAPRTWIDVVGIVADVKHWGLEARGEPRAVPAAAAISVPRRDVRRGGRRRSRVARAGRARSRPRDSIPTCRSRACGRWRTWRRCRWRRGARACCCSRCSAGSRWCSRPPASTA